MSMIISPADITIATTSKPGIVKPDGSDISVNSTTGLMTFDPNGFKLDRKKLFPEGLDITVGTYSTPSSISKGSSNNPTLFTIAEPGIYEIYYCGYVSTNNYVEAEIDLWHSDGTGVAKEIGRACVGNVYTNSTTSKIGFSGSGITIIKPNTEIHGGFSNGSNSTGPIWVSLDYRYRRIYSFDAPSSTPYWWQQ